MRTTKGDRSARLRSGSLGLLAPAACWGVFWGGWAALLPELKAGLDLTDGELGLALFGIPVGALPGMLLAGPLTNRLRGRTLPIVVVLFALSCLLPGLVTGPIAFAATLVLVGATSGAIEVALNTTTAAHEARDGTRLFNKVHAATPLAMVLAAPAVGLARQFGAASWQILLVISVIALISAGLSSDPRPWTTELTEEFGERADVGSAGSRRRTITPILIALGLMAAVVLVMENAVEQWGAIHVEDGLSGTALVASFAPASYMLGLALGRLVAQWRGDQIKPRLLLAAGGVIGAIGITGGALAPNSLVVLVGFGLAGVGLAPAVPTVMSLVGAAASADSRGTAISTVTTISYLGFLGSPPIVGTLAGWVTLPTALTITATGGLLVAVAALVLRPVGRTKSAPAS